MTELNLMEVQSQLEDESRTLGKDRFFKQLADAEKKGEASREGAYRKLIVSGLEMVEAAMAVMVETAQRRGRQHRAIYWIKMFDLDKQKGEAREGQPVEGPMVVAYLAMRVALDGIAMNAKVTDTARRLCDFMLDELAYRRLKALEPQLYDWKMAHFHTSSYRHKKGSLDMTLKYADISVGDLKMSATDKLIVGIKLLDVVAECTGLIELDHGLGSRLVSTQRGRRRHRTLYLKPGPGIKEWIGDKNERMADMTFSLFPMVVPPVDWMPGQRGGYRFKLRQMFPMVRTGDSRVSAIAERSDLPVVFTALNTLQQTAWKINRPIAQVARELLGSGVAGLADANAPPPLYITDSLKMDYALWTAWKTANPGAFTKARGRRGKKKGGIPKDVEAARLRWTTFRRRLGELKDADLPRRSKVVAQGATIRVAERVAQYPAIYFPYTLDFRGRVYPQASFLNPQGDDLSKALLTFAAGKPLGDLGARWLAVHGANLYDTTPEGEKISKMTLEERETWIVRQLPLIRASVADHVNNTWWQQADKPLQFLAFCFEWVAACAERQHTGEWSYVSSLPVSMDGSCNGLQHLSAMFRDEIGGRSVNLTNNDRPRDVYHEVSQTVAEILTKRSTEPYALAWLQSDLINRKLCKRPTMTFGYGSKKWGFRDQLLDDLKGRPEIAKIKRRFQTQDETGTMKEGLGLACILLAECIDEALSNTVVAAARAMHWMQAFANQIANAGLPVTWEVPVTGWRVKQNYYTAIQRQVHTTLAGTKIRPTAHSNSTKVAKHKQANAVSPNIVHSLDAAVLMLTVVECERAGVTSLRMIHDSFGTLAADANKLAEVARWVFVSFYQDNDVAGLLESQLTAQLPEGATIPEMPPMGALDIREVLFSRYFFA